MLQACRSVNEFERLGTVDEGQYGKVYRARDRRTGAVVALKKVKLDRERDGFPLTALREINLLLAFRHPNIVAVHEVVVGKSLDEVFMVMEYLEHDLKFLMRKDVMPRPFSQSQVKCLVRQLLAAVAFLHQHWILHRDLKTSNILYDRGSLKVCDFGMARQYGSPLRPYTQPVVTQWYRPPELLLGTKTYSTAVDMWSVGCIMAELLQSAPLFPGQSELDQLDRIFRLLGTPNERVWPGYAELAKDAASCTPQPYNRLGQLFPTSSMHGKPYLTAAGLRLLSRLLAYDPSRRISAAEALEDPWFREAPLPEPQDLMPTFPARGTVRPAAQYRQAASPDPLEAQARREELEGAMGGAGGLFQPRGR